MWENERAIYQALLKGLFVKKPLYKDKSLYEYESMNKSCEAFVLFFTTI